MSCFKYKDCIILKNGDIYSVWKQDKKLQEFSTQDSAIKFVDAR